MLVAQGEGSSYDKAEIMKRIGNIFQDIIDLHNLKVADMLARRGKTGNKEIEAFDKDRDSLLLQLHQSLADGTFRTSPYTCFTVYEPKERLISSATSSTDTSGFCANASSNDFAARSHVSTPIPASPSKNTSVAYHRGSAGVSTATADTSCRRLYAQTIRITS